MDKQELRRQSVVLAQGLTQNHPKVEVETLLKNANEIYKYLLEVAVPGETFLDRLLAEQMELNDRLVKLGDFINDNPTFHALPEKQKSLLVQQRRLMAAYSDILLERISLIK
jgi:hypothetical protein